MKYSIEAKMKIKIKEDLNDDEYQVFNLNEISNDKTFKWEEKNKEFWYKGKIFDIVKVEKSGVLKCIDDVQEKKLFQNLDSYADSFFAKSPSGKKSLQSINSLFFAVFLPSKEIAIPLRYSVSTTLIPTDIIICNTDRTLTIVSPPPRFL